MLRFRIAKPDENTVAQILAVSALTFLALVVLGLGNLAHAETTSCNVPAVQADLSPSMCRDLDFSN